jgi:multicomponent Na+:H+ antiporter subunit A
MRANPRPWPESFDAGTSHSSPIAVGVTPAHHSNGAAGGMSLLERLAFIALPLLTFAALLWLLAADALPFEAALPWVPSLGVTLAWRIDGLSALMLLLVTGIGAAVFIYAGGYLAGDPRQRMFVLLTAFMAAMIACVAADDLILLFVAWETTSVLSFLLIGFNHDSEASRKAARKALLVTGLGSMALLAGIIVIGQLAGTYSLSRLIGLGPSLPESNPLRVALALIAIGCFAKSAQYPFHFWLPAAMAAPTPISAYLHSATMVKLGVYLLARLDPGFGTLPGWQVGLTLVGTTTSTWAMVLAMKERDLKRILAWSTVAALGTMVTLVGLHTETAPVALGAFILAHALYKAPLFFVVGNIDHGTGTRVIDRLGGLRTMMPFTAAAALMAGISMAGLPLSFGYIAKAVAKEAQSEVAWLAIIHYMGLLVSAASVAVAATAAVRVFWRHPGDIETCEAHEGPPVLIGPPLALAAAGIVFGVTPGMVNGLLALAARAMTPATGLPDVDLELHLGAALGTGLFTVLAGATIFWFWDRIHSVLEGRAERFGASAHYERSLVALQWVAPQLTRLMQHGRLHLYLAALVAATTLSLLVALAAGHDGLPVPAAAWPGLGIAGGAALIAASALLACVQKNRLVLLLASGLVGYGSAILFLFAGAPDLAFTQFAVETVFVVVVAALLLRLQRLGRPTSLDEPWLRPGAAVLSAGFGLALAALVLAVGAAPSDPALATFFGERSVPDAHGRNVVNVILVDFRAIDTLGEIMVVALSLMAALPLLRSLRREPGEGP